jgi:hypothetical protein
VVAGAVGQQLDQRLDGQIEPTGERLDRLAAAPRRAGQDPVDRHGGELVSQGLS